MKFIYKGVEIRLNECFYFGTSPIHQRGSLGGVSRTLKAQAHDVGILQLHYDKVETTRKFRQIEKEESE